MSTTPETSSITATWIKRFPVERITLLDDLKKLREKHGNIPDIQLAWKLVCAGILDSLIRFQNCDVLPNAVDFDGKPLKRDVKNPPVVFRFYSTKQQDGKDHRDGVFLTRGNYEEILANFTSADFCSPEVKNLINDMRKISESADSEEIKVEKIKSAITAFHNQHANPDINYGVIGLMVGMQGDNPCVDVPMMYNKSGHLFERGGTRKVTGLYCFVGGFKEGDALMNMVKETVEEAFQILRVSGNVSKEAVESLEVLRGYFNAGVIDMDPAGLTEKHRIAYQVFEEFFGSDSKMMFLATLLRESAIISRPGSIPDDGKRAIFDMLVKKHGDGVELNAAGKFMYICTAEPELHLAMLQKLRGHGEIYNGLVPNADLGSSAGTKSTKFNTIYFENGELDALLEKTPHIKFHAGDDIENFGSSVVSSERNAKRFDSHALIANFNMAGILGYYLRKVENPASTMSRWFGLVPTVLPDIMHLQYQKMVASYVGREKELSPEMRKVYDSAIKEMAGILKGKRPIARSTTVAPDARAA